jgi:hypothetical protein
VINGKLNKDCVVIGSSRGARNIIASQLEKGTGRSSYNLSYPGSNIEFHDFLLKSLVKFNQKPKIVLLTVDDPEEFLPTTSLNFRFDVLYPLVKYNYINDEMIARGEKNYLSKIFCLSRISISNLDFRKKHFKALDTLRNCGSMPISFQKENTTLIYNTHNQTYSIKNEEANKVKAFLSFQHLCLKNNIQLYIVFSPNYQQSNVYFEKRIRQLMVRKSGLFLYDSSKSIYKNKSYFHDGAHLQTRGAMIFTDELIQFLNEERVSPGIPRTEDKPYPK